MGQRRGETDAPHRRHMVQGTGGERPPVRAFGVPVTQLTPHEASAFALPSEARSSGFSLSSYPVQHTEGRLNDNHTSFFSSICWSISTRRHSSAKLTLHYQSHVIFVHS
eukprot:scaffold56389_cov75-Cyclotella_meneghiniana.AAC.6